MSARERVMSAGLFQSPDLTGTPDRASANADVSSPLPAGRWNPESFAQEQIQGLVRRVFFSNAARPVRQIVFSAVEAETDVHGICRRVGEILALETPGTVAVMGGYPRLLQDAGREHEQMAENETKAGTVPPLRRIAARVRGNLWLVPGAGSDGDRVTNASLHSYLSELRREFEYSIVEGAPAGGSNDTTAMAQFADGIILVLSAQHTRRVTARKIKEELEGAQARLLGTVLSDRVFPIPEGIYRRL
jgi:hypothetical protein